MLSLRREDMMLSQKRGRLPRPLALRYGGRVGFLRSERLQCELELLSASLWNGNA